SGDAGQRYRPPWGGRVPNRGSTLIRSRPPDLSHRIGDAAGALTAFTAAKVDLRGPRSSPALALRELSFSTTEELEPQGTRGCTEDPRTLGSSSLTLCSRVW